MSYDTILSQEAVGVSIENAEKRGLLRGHVGKDLVFTSGDTAPFFFLNDWVESEEISIGFTNAVRLAGENTRKAQQAACNGQYAD